MLKEGPDEKGHCQPNCVFFKCGNRSINVQDDAIQCLWINDDCIGSSCSYALCVRGKMLAGNKCGLIIRRATLETKRPDDLDLNTKLKSRLTKRIKNVDDLI